jgi:hypothetical protein
LFCESLSKNGAEKIKGVDHAMIGQGVVYGLPIALGGDQPTFSEHFEMAGDGRLR